MNTTIDDDDVICLDDPYEQLDSKPKKSPKKLIQEANKVVRLNQDLNVSPVSLSKLNSHKTEVLMIIDLTSKDDELRNCAIKNGFKKDEIHHAFKVLAVDDHIQLMNEQQFLQYLSLNKDISKCSIDSSKYSAFSKSSAKIDVDNEDDDDVKIVDQIKKKVEPKLVFQEYAQMVNKQGFANKFKEFENKEARMRTLTLGMSDADQQKLALSKINALKTKNEASPPPIKFNMTPKEASPPPIKFKMDSKMWPQHP